MGENGHRARQSVGEAGIEGRQKAYRFSRRQLLAYAFPAMVASCAVVPVNAILPTLYAKHASVSVVAAGSVFFLRSIYDAVSDVIIGYLSDRTTGWLGPRLPWIIAGGILTALSVAMLYRVPETADVIYFGVWTIAFFTGTTMIGIPHNAWGSELSPEYAESTRIFSYRSFFDSLGTFTVSATPLILMFLGVLRTSDYSLEAVKALGVIIMVLMPLSIVTATLFAPRAKPRVVHEVKLFDVLDAIRKNRIFLRFICAYIIAGFGYGFFVALIFPYITSYLGIGEAFPVILLVVTSVQILVIPAWTWIINRLGKHRAWAWGWITNSLVMLPLWFVAPGKDAVVPVVVALGLYAATNGVSAIAPFSLLGNIADYDRLKTRRNHAGQFFAFMLFATKLLGSAGGVGLILLGGVFGYDLSDAAENTDFARFGMLLLFIVVPGLFQLASVALIWNFPLDERRQNIIARRLEQYDRETAT